MAEGRVFYGLSA